MPSFYFTLTRSVLIEDDGFASGFALHILVSSRLEMYGWCDVIERQMSERRNAANLSGREGKNMFSFLKAGWVEVSYERESRPKSTISFARRFMALRENSLVLFKEQPCIFVKTRMCVEGAKISRVKPADIPMGDVFESAFEICGKNSQLIIRANSAERAEEWHEQLVLACGPHITDQQRSMIKLETSKRFAFFSHPFSKNLAVRAENSPFARRTRQGFRSAT